MLEDAAQPSWKLKKKDRLLKRFEKFVDGIQARHDKLVEKGCIFEKISQSAGAREDFVNHSEMCQSMSVYITG